MSNNISAPGPNDVLCGRGNHTNVHKGNQFFRILVQNFKLDYVISKNDEKKVITNVIITTIRNLNPPGRFLKRDPKTNLWNDIGDQNAFRKTSQALREGAPEILKGIAPSAISVPSKSLSSSKASEVNDVNKDDAGEKSKYQSLKFKRTLKTEPQLENKDTPRQETGSVHHFHDTCVSMTSGSMSSIGSGENIQMELPSFQVESFQECSVEIDKIFGGERLPNSHHGSCSSTSALFSMSDDSMSMSDLSLSFLSSFDTSDLSAILQLV